MANCPLRLPSRDGWPQLHSGKRASEVNQNLSQPIRCHLFLLQLTTRKTKFCVDLLLEKRIASQTLNGKVWLSLQHFFKQHHVRHFTLQTGHHKHKTIPTMSAEQGQRERQDGQTPASSTTALMDLKHQQASLTERLDALHGRKFCVCYLVSHNDVMIIAIQHAQQVLNSRL